MKKTIFVMMTVFGLATPACSQTEINSNDAAIGNEKITNSPSVEPFVKTQAKKYFAVESAAAINACQNLIVFSANAESEWSKKENIEYAITTMDINTPSSKRICVRDIDEHIDYNPELHDKTVALFRNSQALSPEQASKRIIIEAKKENLNDVLIQSLAMKRGASPSSIRKALTIIKNRVDEEPELSFTYFVLNDNLKKYAYPE